MGWLQSLWDSMSSEDGNAIAGWGGLLISIVGFGLTYLAARASKLASERALHVVKNIDVLQTLSDSVGILEHIKELHDNKAESRVMLVHYSSVCRLLNSVTPLRTVLTDEEKAALKSVVLHAKLAQEEYSKVIRDRAYGLDHARLVSNLLNDVETLSHTLALIRDRIGEDYVRHKSQAGA